MVAQLQCERMDHAAALVSEDSSTSLFGELLEPVLQLHVLFAEVAALVLKVPRIEGH